MEFRILGPLDVREHGRSIPLGGPKQRALLAILLLNANQVVSRDTLVDELGEPSSGEGGNALNVQISRLRKVLGQNGEVGSILETRPPGYRLRVEVGALDLECFELLVAEGRAALARGDARVAATKLREADALWRGRPLADLEFEPFARLDVERLEDLRLGAIEDRVDAELELGRHSELVPELEALAGEHPLRERLRAALMLALYRAGRQAEALEAYRAGRAVLVEELGLDPSPQLRSLEQAILRHDQGLAQPPARTDDRAPRETLDGLDADGGPPVLEPPPGRARSRMLRVGGVGVVVAAALVGTVLLATSPGGGASVPLSGNGVALVSPAGKLLATVDLPAPPTGLAVGFGSVWVTHADDNVVTRVDPGKRAVQDRIQMTGGPSSIVVAAGGVWVAGRLTGTVSRIDPSSDTVTKTIAVGSRPSGMAYAAGSLWVANHGDGTVSRLDPRTARVLAVISVGRGPTGVAARGRSVWVANEDAGTVVAISTISNAVVQTIRSGDAPSAIAAGAGGVWVADSLDATLSRIDSRRGTVVATVTAGGSAGALALANGAAWLPAREPGAVVQLVDRGGIAASAHAVVGGEPVGIAAAGDGVWVAVKDGGPSHRGGTLRVLVDMADLYSIDPAKPVLTFSGFMDTNDGLVSLNHVPGADGGQLVPDLAMSLPVVGDDGRDFTFRLRSGIRYSTGSRVVARDVRRSLERAFEVRSSTAPFYDAIAGARACERERGPCDLSRGIVVDDASGTITFHLAHRDPDFLYKLVYAYVLPASTPGQLRHPAPATGPYMVSSYVPRTRVVLVRNPYFREWSKAAQPDGYPARIVWSLGLKPGAMEQAMMRNRADFMNNVGGLSGDVSERFRSRRPSQVRTNTTLLANFYFLNTKARPFDDIRARRALNFALDRGAIVRGYGAQGAKGSCQVLPPQIPGYVRYCPYTRRPGAGGDWHGPDLQRARRLVAASGTRGMKVTLWYLREPASERIEDRAIVTALRRIGYRPSLRTLPDSRYFAYTGDVANKAQITVGGWSADYPTASNFIARLTCANAKPPGQHSYDHSFFCDRGFDRRVAEASLLQTTNPERANAMWARLDHTLTDRAIWLPTVTPSQTDIVSRRVGNYQYHAAWGALIDQMWVR